MIYIEMRKLLIASFTIFAMACSILSARTTATSNMTTMSRSANTRPITVSEFVSPTSYETMYPYMNNTMKTNMNPGVTPSYSALPTSLTVHKKTIETRQVVPRSATTSSARSATVTNNTVSTARTPTVSTSSNVYSPANNRQSTTTSRKVVARSSTRPDSGLNNVYATGTKIQYTVSADRCLSDYVDCMDDYCERADTAYNRCYCSSKLAQIDDEYRPQIDSLVQQILTINSTDDDYWSDEEFYAYWDETIGVHTGDNSWRTLDELLSNIDWAGTESSVRGQQSFITGHDYCTQHLKACAYMSGNMRDMYKSEIARDCTVYENGLNRLKTAAEDYIRLSE